MVMYLNVMKFDDVIYGVYLWYLISRCEVEDMKFRGVVGYIYYCYCVQVICYQ